MKSFDRALGASSRRGVLSFALCGLLAALVACEDDGPFGRDDEVDTVEFTSPAPTVEIGSTAQLAFEIRDADGDLIDPNDVTIDFSTSSATVATVSETGLVTPVAVGQAVVTIEVAGVTDTITVDVIAEITSINVVETEIDLITDETSTLAITVLNAAGNPVTDPSLTFTSSNTAVVSVDDDGVLTAESPGTATITVAGGGASDTVVVTVVAAASGGLSATGSTFTVTTGDEVVINDLIVARDAGGVIIVDPELVFTTTDAAVVTVDATGMLVANAEGSALVTVTSPDATGSATVRVNVLDVGDLDLLEVDPATATLAIAGTVDLDVTAENAEGDPVDDLLAVFTSSNPAVATVDPLTGVVTAIAVGTATITATIGDLTAEAVITVQ
jgi:uncharacterized protein YjdB